MKLYITTVIGIDIFGDITYRAALVSAHSEDEARGCASRVFQDINPHYSIKHTSVAVVTTEVIKFVKDNY